jgi:hypothetical protein
LVLQLFTEAKNKIGKALNKKIIISILLTVSFTLGAYAQIGTDKVKNLQKFDQQTIHFGFLLGLNSADFSLFRNPPADTLLSIEVTKQSGFNLGIISALHFNEYFSLRFTPNLSFAQRTLNYEFYNPADTLILRYDKIVESTYINFPLTLKYKSMRFNNFAAYIIGGGAFVLDLASNKDVNNAHLQPNDVVVKINKTDWRGEIGVGTDFYLPYFKFAIELKMSYGLRDILIHDNTIFSNPINKMRAKMFLLSFTFEG